MFFLLNVFSFDEDADLAEKVKLASENEEAFGLLARDFEKHNRFIASRVTGRFITESDDEWSVVLLAFFEAVRSYRPDRGSFTAFSDMVIKRRLIDDTRSRSRAAREISVDMNAQELPGSDSETDTAASPLMRQVSEQTMAAAEEEARARDIKWEIEGLNRVLSAYGIAFTDLPDVSPKADKTRRACAVAIMTICGDSELLARMKQGGRLPAADVSKKAGIPLKLLDKHRKYIIAVVEIMTGDYPELQHFTDAVKSYI